MRSISEKSTGQLADELITNAFKVHFALASSSPVESLEQRYELLRAALLDRLGQDVAPLLHDLAVVSCATWHAQEVVMHEINNERVADAGRQAQRLNARRSGIVREMDRLLGEAAITITTKTYG